MPIVIKSRFDGLRVAGVLHPREITKYPDSFFTPEQFEELQREELLIVTITDEVDHFKLAEIVEEVMEAPSEGDLTKEGIPRMSILEKLYGSDLSTFDRDQALVVFAKSQEDKEEAEEETEDNGDGED